VHVTGGIVHADAVAALQQHRTGVQPFFELHDAHTGFRVSGEDGAMDGSGAAPARQQRPVDVEATQSWQRKHHRGQDEAIGHHHEQLRSPFGQRGAPFGGLERGGLRNGQAMLRGQ
jgi:hypothetical protein